MENIKRKTIMLWGGNGTRNIGDAFIDLGATYILNNITEANIILSSFMPSWFLSRGFSSIYDRLLDGAVRDKTSNLFDVRCHAKSDYNVITGVRLTKNWLKRCIFDKKLNFNNKNTKFIILGCGGLYYNTQEYEAVRNYMKKMNVYAFIARDKVVFNEYKDIAEHSYCGIDCAFFLNDCFKPPALDISNFVTLSFDGTSNEPKLNLKGKKVIRTHHSCWTQNGLIKGIIFNYLYSKQGLNKKNTLISDLPQDYLAIYANTDETHSDRMHACIATLAFGKPAKLYRKTNRAYLLDRVDAGSVKNELSSLNMIQIRKEKDRELEFLADII